MGDAEQLTGLQLWRSVDSQHPLFPSSVHRSPYYHRLIFHRPSVSSAGALHGAPKTALFGLQTLCCPPWAQPHSSLL